MERAPSFRDMRLFGPSSQRALRLRAHSDLDRTDFRSRSSSVRQLAESSVENPQHGRLICELLDQLDNTSKNLTIPLTAIAGDDRLLLSQSPETLVEAFASSLSWANASYYFDASTYLIDKLQTIYSAGSDASCKWYILEDYCQRLKNELFLANILYLLRRLQSFLFQILVHKCKRQVNDFAHYLLSYLELRDTLDKSCVKEWPSGQRLLSTTWPWNIRPSLVVLWGVCWMFYYPPPKSGNRSARSQAQRDASSFAFAEEWSQNLPRAEVEPDAQRSMGRATDPYSEPTQAERPRSGRSRAVAQQALQSWPPSGRPMTDEDLLAGFNASDIMYSPQLTSSGADLSSRWLANDSAAAPALYISHGGSVSVPATSWPDFSAALSPLDGRHYSSNPPAWQPIYQTQLQYSNRIIPSLEVSPSAPSTFSSINYSTAPSRQQFLHSRRTSQAQDSFASSMGEAQFYPLSPRSERQPSIPTSVASASSALMSPEHSSPASESSHRPRATIKRERSPPRNEAGQIYCDHRDCANKILIFKRPCEWNKHMDKHDRPYKCKEPGCEQNPGFTYSGGLLRHQREVHKMHMSARQPLFCPFPNCNRSSGTGFTRRENLEEHKRRRHLGESVDSSTATAAIIPMSSSPASTTNSMPPPSLRKRSRVQHTISDADPEDDDDEEDNEDEDTSDSVRVIKRLKDELRYRDASLRQQDDIIRRQQAELSRLQQRLGVAPASPRVPATRA